MPPLSLDNLKYDNIQQLGHQLTLSTYNSSEAVPCHVLNSFTSNFEACEMYRPPPDGFWHAYFPRMQMSYGEDQGQLCKAVTYNASALGVCILTRSVTKALQADVGCNRGQHSHTHTELTIAPSLLGGQA